MSINKNALLRYQTLDKCFSNTGRGYTFEDLLEEVNKVLIEDNPNNSGIQIRQLREDINNMKKESIYGAPIVSRPSGNGRKHFYYYEDPNFSINNRPLNTTESIQLNNVLTIFNRFENSPGFEWVSEIGVKLKDSFHINDNRKVISFENNIDYEGYKYITPIFNSIVNERVLKIKYQPFDKKEFELIFHPYYLKQFNNRWFVFGHNKSLDVNDFNLALDRIQEINETDEKYLTNTIEWDEYFDNIYGVTKIKDSEEVEIILQFNKEQAPYIITKPIHPYQKNQKNENGVLVKIKLIPNFELEQLILSYGEKVEVISPKSLKIKIKNRICEINKLYR